MRNARRNIVIALVSAFVVCPVVGLAQEPEGYSVAVGNGQICFVAKPELGYVVKLVGKGGGIGALGGVLSLEGAQAKPIRGLGRKGIWVVERAGPANENEKTISALGSQGQVQYAAPLFSCEDETVAIIPEIVVRVTAETDIRQVSLLCAEMDLAIKKRIEFTDREYLIEVLGTDARAVFEAVEQLNNNSLIEWAAANIAFQPKLCGQVVPNDQYFPNQWHLHNTGQTGGTPGADIDAPEAWEITVGDPNIVIAILDTGVDTNHPDLIDNLVPGYDFYDDDNLPDPGLDDPNDAHGTMCAGLVAASGNNGLGVTGVVWNCRIMPVRIAATGGFITEADIATATRWAASNGADILSNSWGSRSCTFTLRSAIMDVTEPGGIGREGKACVALFSSANDGHKIFPGSPAIYAEVIAVGATDPNDERYEYSNYGPELDLVTPSGYHGGVTFPIVPQWTTDITGYAGYSVYNSEPNVLDYTEAMGGTSAACPVAAGVAALILSVEPNLTNLEVQRILLRSARDLGEAGRDDYYGYGRVDARAALQMALSPPATWFVDDDGANDPGPNDPNISDPLEHGSAEHPFDSIQEGIDVGFPGEIVILLPGIYAGQGNRDIDFAGKSITVRSTNPNDPGAGSQTVIDCQGTEADPHRGFFFHSGETSESVLAGLTIINGNANTGGAIYCCNNARPVITKCVFRRNSAAKGGAMLNYRANPTVTHCIFATNTAESGGGMYNQTSIPVVANCTFAQNSARPGQGGAICSVSGNPTLTNCILWGDTPDEVYVSGGTPVITCSDVQGGFSGEGNIDADPLFADSESGDFHLKSQAGRWDPNSQTWVKDAVTSPCIDAGNPSSDLTEELWPHGKRINMGAYGGTAQASMSPSNVGNIADLNNDDSVDYRDMTVLTAKWPGQGVLLSEDLDRDGIVDMKDYCILADNWLWEQ